MITIYKNLFQNSVPFYRTIDFIFERIRSGKSKDLIEQIRKEKNKQKRNDLKNKLPAICFSGTFTIRKAENLIQHSGYIILDFDNYPSNEEMIADKDKFIKDKYVYALFISPSGNGLKVLVKIPPIADNHKEYFNGLSAYFKNQYLDNSGSDICRVCFESYDPDLYVNQKSKVFDKLPEDIGFNFVDKVPTVILTDYAEIMNRLLKWWEKKHGMVSGQRNANLFILASSFNDYGVPENDSKYFCRRFIEKDFDEREIERIIKSAYSKKAQFGTKYFEDHEKIKYIKKEFKSGKPVDDVKKENPNISPDVIEQISESNTTTTFWNLSSKGKITIDNLKYKTWLQLNGFYKYYPEVSDSFVFIKIENNLIDNTTEVKVKDFVLNYLLDQKEFQVYQYMTSFPRFFKEDMLNTLDSTEVVFKKDTKDVSYLYFKNCAVEVYADKILTIDYIDLDGYVWKKHIIDFEFNGITSGGDFEKFINNISGKDIYRNKSIKSTIGYLLSSYKNSSNNVAVILNDEMISENPEGGTGKGIIVNAVSKLKRCAIIDGKTFSFQKSFPYQTVSADTQIIIFDDVIKNFPFENLFSVVTEGITLEKKNKDAIKIPVSKSPKVLITTNYAIAGDGNSFERRKWELELCQYYKKSFTPYDEFGKLLFDDWDDREWIRFYSFMINCLQLYIANGLIKSEFNNLKIRQFIAKTSYDFHEWSSDAIQHNERLNKSELFEKFIYDFPDYKKWLSRKKFSAWLEIYAAHIGAESETGNTNGMRWIKIITKSTDNYVSPFDTPDPL